MKNIIIKFLTVILFLLILFFLPEDIVNLNAFLPVLVFLGFFAFSAFYFIKTNILDIPEQTNINNKPETEPRNKKIQKASIFFYFNFLMGPFVGGIGVGLIFLIYLPNYNILLFIFSSLVGLLVGIYWMYYVVKGKGNSNSYLPLYQSDDMTKIFDEKKWKDNSGNGKNT